MKIGILSMQRVINHGSFWQAYLMKKWFSEKGHQVEFIDIIPGRKLFEFHRIFDFSKLNRIPYKLFYIPEKKRILKDYQITLLGCTPKPNYSDDYDCIIIGSDEVFNFSQYTPWGFSKQLHGGIDNDNVNSYAASFGSATYDDINKYDVRDELVCAFSNLKNISVRDDNSQYIISRLLPDVNIHRHLDPVLVGDLPIPERTSYDQKYIAIYAYDFRFNDEEYIRAIKKFAKKNGLKTYSIGFYQTWVDININCDPLALLQYFVNAEYIVTDTFHGVIFSARCHKKFATVIRRGTSGNEQKLMSLLNDLVLKERVLTDANYLEKILMMELDYEAVDAVLQLERARTDAYLEKCLIYDI